MNDAYTCTLAIQMSSLCKLLLFQPFSRDSLEPPFQLLTK